MKMRLFKAARCMAYAMSALVAMTSLAAFSRLLIMAMETSYSTVLLRNRLMYMHAELLNAVYCTSMHRSCVDKLSQRTHKHSAAYPALSCTNMEPHP